MRLCTRNRFASAISALKAFETSPRATLIKMVGLVSLKTYRYL